jgi:hypothetical protein
VIVSNRPATKYPLWLQGLCVTIGLTIFASALFPGHGLLFWIIGFACAVGAFVVFLQATDSL